jgi:hypothetical protein
MRSCYLDCHEAGHCCCLVITHRKHITSLTAVFFLLVTYLLTLSRNFDVNVTPPSELPAILRPINRVSNFAPNLPIIHGEARSLLGSAAIKTAPRASEQVARQAPGTRSCSRETFFQLISLRVRNQCAATLRIPVLVCTLRKSSQSVVTARSSFIGSVIVNNGRVSIATGYALDDQGIGFDSLQENFFFFTASKPALGPT